MACEAARRNAMALYEIELAWGNGIVDLGKLRGILAPKNAQACTCHNHETPEILGKTG